MDSEIIFGLDLGSLVAVSIAIPYVIYVIVKSVKEWK